MFTGLIETLGKVAGARKSGAGMLLSIDVGEIGKTAKNGDSINVNGVCLTVSKLAGSIADFDISGETLSRTTLGKLTAGKKVNLEQAMKADGRFGGHFVQGHVDGIGTIKEIRKSGDFYDVTFAAQKELLDSMVVKGSVAVDGISLTIAEMNTSKFSVAIIPVTWRNTNLATLKIGDKVNIETDVVVKTIKKQVSLMLGQEKGLTIEKLKEMGF